MFYDKDDQYKANILKQNFVAVTAPEDGAQVVNDLFQMTRGWEIRKEERMETVVEFLQPANQVQQASVERVKMRWSIDG